MAKLLGSEHVLVVHSRGLDEIAPEGPTRVCELNGGAISEYEIVPEDFGIASHSANGLRADSVEASLSLFRAALTQPDSAAADVVALNAGAGIYVAGLATSFANGVTMAQDAIASGLAKERLDEFVRITSLMAEP